MNFNKGAKSPSDFLSEFTAKMGNDNIFALSSRSGNPGVQPLAADPRLNEAMGIISKCQVEINRLGMELKVMAKEKDELKSKVKKGKKKGEELSVALNTIKSQETEKLQIIADKVQLEAEIEELKKKTQKNDQDEDDMKAKLEAATAELETLKSQIATMTAELEAAKSKLAAHNLGTVEGTQGETQATNETLTAEEAAARAAAADTTEDNLSTDMSPADKALVKELDAYMEKMYDPSCKASDLRAYQEFIKKNKDSLTKLGAVIS